MVTLSTRRWNSLSSLFHRTDHDVNESTLLFLVETVSLITALFEQHVAHALEILEDI